MHDLQFSTFINDRMHLLLYHPSCQLGCQLDIYLFKVNNKNTRKRCEICSKLTIKTPERRQLPQTREHAFKALSNISDGAFFRKKLTAESRNLD